MSDRSRTTRFKPGQSGNPAGRPKGARSRLSEDFLEALSTDFAEHGRAVIEKVRSEKPDQYLKVVAAVVPKEIHLPPERSVGDMSDAELMAIARGFSAAPIATH